MEAYSYNDVGATQMTVMFGYTGDFKKISSVYFLDGDRVSVRRYRDDGTTVDRLLMYHSIVDAYRDLNSSINPLYPAEVSDVRSAFKYLGKSSELIDLLPEAELGSQQESTG